MNIHPLCIHHLSSHLIFLPVYPSIFPFIYPSTYPSIYPSISLPSGLVSVLRFRQKLAKVKWFTDGAQFHRNHELIIWLWSSTMAKTNWCTKFTFACVPMRLLPSKSLRAKANRAITKVIAWDSPFSKFKCMSFVFNEMFFLFRGIHAKVDKPKVPALFSGKSLLEGIFPSHDQFGNNLMGDRALKAGTPICGGWRAGFESWCGDWKERSLSHCFVKRNSQSTQVCDQCDAIKPFAATSSDLLRYIYTDFRLDAPWTTTIRDHQTYLDQTPADHVTPWVEVPGFTITRVKWDSAHTILLGVGKDLAASFLYDFVFWLYWSAGNFLNPFQKKN